MRCCWSSSTEQVKRMFRTIIITDTHAAAWQFMGQIWLWYRTVGLGHEHSLILSPLRLQERATVEKSLNCLIPGICRRLQDFRCRIASEPSWRPTTAQDQAPNEARMGHKAFHSNREKYRSTTATTHYDKELHGSLKNRGKSSKDD